MANNKPKTLCSCILCKREITTSNIFKHHGSVGCLEFRPKWIKLTNCIHCNLDLTNISGPVSRNHLRWCKSNPKANTKNYKTAKYCLECNSSHSRRSKYCSINCGELQRKTPEYKEKISLGRKLFLKNNPDKHPWKNNYKHISVSCEIVKSFLTKHNINFVEEFQPLEDRFFSIDIAFPDIKFGIEVNGNQHYNSDGTLSEYYQNRHDLIVSSGWTLIELHYTKCYNEDFVLNLLEIREQPDYSEYFMSKLNKQKSNSLPKGQTTKLKSDARWNPLIMIVKESGIDFSKFGWVNHVSKLLGIKSQKVNAWMKRYLPDIYENLCFKRKGKIT